MQKRITNEINLDASVMSFTIHRFAGRKKDLSAYGPAGSGAPAAGGDDNDDDDDIDLFGSDDEDAKAEREKRLAEYAAKKAKSE